MEKLASKVLNKVLGSFIENLDSDQLDISLFKGKIELKNLSLKKDFLYLLGLPFNMNYGLAKNILIKISWRKLDSKPVRITISDVQAYLTPKDPKVWNREKEEEDLEKTKKAQLNRFEVLQVEEEEDEEAEEGKIGYFKKKILTVVNNLEIKVENICIRYEHNLESQPSFTAGIFLRLFELQTCNSSWEKAFNLDTKLSFKCLNINEFFVYFDYIVPHRLQDLSSSPIDIAVETISRMESNRELEHNFLIEPSFFQIKLTINPKEKLQGEALFKAEVDFEKISLKFYTFFPALMTNLNNLIKFSRTFTAGVKKTLNEQDFEPNVLPEYKKKYRDFLILMQKDEKKQADKVLIDLAVMEKRVTWENILKVRKIVVDDHKIELKLKKIQNLQNKMSKKTLSTMFTDSEKLKIKCTKKIEELKSELAQLQGLTRNLKSTEIDNKFKAHFTLLLRSPSLSIVEKDESPLYEITYDQIQLTLKKIGESPDISLTIRNLQIADCALRSPLFPNLLSLSNFKIEASMFQMNFNIKCEKLYVFILFPTIHQMFSSIQTSIKENVVQTNSSELFGSNYDFITTGLTYMQENTKKASNPSKPLNLTLDIDAPLIFIPWDYIKQNSVLCMDFGSIFCTSSVKMINPDLSIDNFPFTFKQLSIYVIKSWEDLKSQSTFARTNILSPVSIEVQVTKPRPNPKNDRELKVNIDSKAFEFSLNSEIFAAVGPIFELVDKNLPEKKTETNEDISVENVRERLMMKMAPARSDPMLVNFNLERILVLISSTSKIATIELNELKLKNSVDEYKNSKIEFGIVEILIRDDREGTKAKDIIYNPKIDWLKKVGKDENNNQISINFYNQKLKLVTDIGFVMQDLKIYLNFELLNQILGSFMLVGKSLGFLQRLKILKPKKAMYSEIRRTWKRVSLFCHQIDLEIPTTFNETDLSTNTSFNMTATIESESTSIVYFSNNRNLLSSKDLFKKDEFTLVLSHLTSIITLPNMIYTVLQPSRFMVESKVETNYEEFKSESKMILRLESFVLFFGFGCLDYLKGLGQTLAKMGKNKKSKAKEPSLMRSTLQGSIDIDALQFFIINDREKELESLLVHKCSYTTLTIFKSPELTSLSGDIIMNTEYYNPSLTCWEPLLEDTKLTLTISSNNLGKIIDFNFPNTVNLNLTKGLFNTLAELKRKILPSDENNIRNRPVKRKLKVVKYFEYILQNRLDVGFDVWLALENDPLNKYLEPGRYKNYSSDYVQKLATLNNKRAKSTTIMSSIQTPTMICFMFSGEAVNFNVDKPGIYLQTVELEKENFEIMIRVFSEIGKRYVSFESIYKLANNTDIKIVAQYKEEVLECVPFRMVSIPVKWQINDINLKVGENLLPYGLDGEINYKDLVLVHQLSKYKIKKSKFYIFELSYKFYISNLLHTSIEILNSNSSKLLKTSPLVPGSESVLHTSPDFHIQVLETTETFTSESSDFLGIQDKILEIAKNPGRSISIHIAEKLFTEYTLGSERFENIKFDLNDIDKEEKEATFSFYPHLITVFSDYIIVNKTDHDLSIYDLVLPKHSRSFFSTDHNKIKLKLANEDSTWSEEFRIDTVGVSGALETLTSSDAKPIALGIRISEGPEPIKLTTIINLVPRYIICNYLDSCVFIRQPGQSAECLRLPASSDKSSCGLSFDFSESTKEKFVQISLDNENWSSNFKISQLNEFQVKVPKPQVVEKKKSKRVPWYLKSEVHYVQIIINTNDESSLNILIMNPKDPDFRIFNYTHKEIRFSQVGVDDKEHVLKAGDYDHFAWDDHSQSKKRLKLQYDGKEDKYSIEKIFFQKASKGTTIETVDSLERNFRKLGPCSVYLEIKDSTRELYIKSPDYAKEEEESFTQRITSYRSFEQLSTTSLDSNRPLFTFKLKIKDFGLSLFDLNNRENFYFSAKDLNLSLSTETSEAGSRKERKFHTKLKLKHLQIDSCDPDSDLFPVILSPNTEAKEEDSSNQYYLMFELELIDSFKKLRSGEFAHSMKIIENFDFVLQKTQVKLNEETLLKLAGLASLFKILKSSSPENIENCEVLKVFYAEPQVLRPSSLQKCYFHFIKLGVMQFNLTFQRSGKVKKTKELIKLFRVLKAVGGAFVNISNSKLNFKEVIIVNSFQTIQNFRSVVVKNYSRQGLAQVYKIFGAIDILGNPLSLIETLGTGVYEFMTEPAKGLIGGPKAFVVGVGKGVRSLVTSVIKGSFESVSKITGGLYNVLKSATGENQTSQVADSGSIGKNMLTGLKEGASDILSGFTGVVMKPYQGAKSKGAKGLASGIISGTAGLLVSPFKLILKLGTVLSSSIASTASLIAEGKIQTFGRARFPRHWTSKVAIEAYDDGFAQAQAFLYNFEDFREERIIYFTQVLLCADGKVKKNCQIFIIVTLNWLIYVKDAKLKKKVQIFDLARLEVHLKAGVYFLAVGLKDSGFVVPSQDFAGVACIFNRLSEYGLKSSGEERFYECPKMIDLGLKD